MARKGKKKSNASSSSLPISSQWDNLPRDMLEMIFKDLLRGDRIRMLAVCKSWNTALTEAKDAIPHVPEGPWQILSNDSYAFPESSITEVSFRSTSEDKKIYRIKVPNHSCCWLCGASNGWLLMASGHKSNPNIFIWDPINGSTRNLPSLSTHPHYKDLVEQGGSFDNVSCLFDRVLVFPQDSSAQSVVVAVIFKNFGRQIAFCAPPQDKSWAIYQREEYETIYIDFLYHSKSRTLFVLGRADLLTNHAYNWDSRKTIDLAGGCTTVRLSFIFLNRRTMPDDDDLTSLYEFTASHVYPFEEKGFRLVEDTINDGGNVLLMLTCLDRVVRTNMKTGAKGTTVLHRTGTCTIQSRERALVESIGHRAMFLGSTNTNAIVISGPVKGIETDSVYLAIDDSRGFCSDGERFISRELGIFSLKTKKIKQRHCKNVKYPAPSTIGWFQPKF